MKRVSRFMVGISLLITGLAVVPLASASAMNNSSGSNTCENKNSYPAPYTGGANIAKYFHLADGSTVTLTQTGAVIKQSPCHTAYREGWINVSDICDINSAQDLNGRLASGSTNPYGQANFTNCSTSSQTSTSQRPAEPASQSQSQSQSITVNVPQVQAAVTARPAVQTTQSTAAVRTLPNTGPGNILMLSGATTAVGTLGHLIYSRRKRLDK